MFISENSTDYTVDGRNVCFPPHLHRMCDCVIHQLCRREPTEAVVIVTVICRNKSYNRIQRRFGTTCHETPLSTLPTYDCFYDFMVTRLFCAQDRYSVSTYLSVICTPGGVCSQSTEDDTSCELRSPFRCGSAPHPTHTNCDFSCQFMVTDQTSHPHIHTRALAYARTHTH